PLFMRGGDQPAMTSTIERHRDRLTVYYGRVLRNLHDLDEDFATHKLNEDEYTVEREQWVQRGVAVLKALDELDGQHLLTDEHADDATIDSAIDSAIESAIQDYRTQTESTLS
ncbi:MAG: hypothetical protein RLP44_25485, partial [Aggregatilineales bacterium]